MCTCSYIYVFWYTVEPPDIDEGSFVPRPSVFTLVNEIIKIGSPVYIYPGYNVTIVCNIVTGVPPIVIQWHLNGSPYSTGGNLSVTNLTITNANDGDFWQCRVSNRYGIDIESTTIHVLPSEYVCICNIYIFVTHCIYIYTY